MTTYNISINNELDFIIKSEMKKGCYANRSEFFRELIRNRYVIKQNNIEILHENDDDYRLIEKRKKTAEFMSVEDIKMSL